MSDYKMQVIVKSYDKTEFKTAVSAEDGNKLIKNIKKNITLIESENDLLDLREIIGDLRDQPLNFFEKRERADQAFTIIDGLIRYLEGADE